MLKRYKFYGGKKVRTGTIEPTKILLGGRVFGFSERVNVGIIRKGGTRIRPFAEKHFKEEFMGKLLKPKIVFILNELKKLGLSTVPTARIAVEQEPEGTKKVRQIMTDLTQGGKFEVVDYKAFTKIVDIVRNLNNFKQINEQIAKEEQTAFQNGFKFYENEWLVVIDKKTNTGKPYIVDVKNTKLLNDALDKKLWDFESQFE